MLAKISLTNQKDCCILVGVYVFVVVVFGAVDFEGLLMSYSNSY